MTVASTTIEAASLAPVSEIETFASLSVPLPSRIA
ncbi:hypothetical protein GGE42_000875 [Rhizobium leguminosarum]|nr:hypothetical protein [Rhizobium leguminosarum]